MRASTGDARCARLFALRRAKPKPSIQTPSFAVPLPMKGVHAGVALLFALWAACACAAERGLYTIVDGDARVLRKTTWYRLEAGARVDGGDVIEVPDRGQIQFETATGGAVSVIGPALGYLVEGRADAKAQPVPDFTLVRGWLKAANTPKAPPVRIDFPSSALKIANGIVVVHCDPVHTEFFVESGRPSLLTAAPRGKEQAREVAEGEFWHKSGDRAFETDDRPPQAFVAAMPRALRDALPTLAGKFEGAPPTLPAGREVTFAEAEPLLSGPSRHAFARRFASRLSDPAFRSAAAAARPGVPEWDRTLHPERYRPRDADEKAASAQP
jgi:hypothetical protein